MPTRLDTDLRVRVAGTSALLLTGNPDLESEHVVAYEAGYRIQPLDRVSLDVAAFVNRYDDLRSQEPTPPTGVPVVLGNGLRARTRGAELAGNLLISDWWQAHASYSYLWSRFSADPTSRDVTGGSSEASDPSHLFSARTYLNLPHNLELDGFFRFAGALPVPPPTGAYGELDVRLGWRASPDWHLAVIGRNLLHDRHLEFVAGTPREEFERAIQLRSTWRF
jgi:iron complex outermembrane receptor protein